MTNKYTPSKTIPKSKSSIKRNEEELSFFLLNETKGSIQKLNQHKNGEIKLDEIQKKRLEIKAEIERKMREKLFNKYDNYALKIAYINKNNHVDMDDIIQAARLGLLKAIDNFDASKGVTLTTYAYRKVQKEIQNEKRINLQFFKVPEHVQRDLWRIQKYQREYLLINREHPSFDQISKDLNISIKHLEDYQNVYYPMQSLDDVKDKDGLPLIDQIPDKRQTILDKIDDSPAEIKKNKKNTKKIKKS